MNSVILMINYFGLFLKDAVLDVIPLGSILIASLSIGTIISLAQARVKGGK